MLRFYKKAASFFVLILISSLAALYFCLENAYMYEDLIPAKKSVFGWKVNTESDKDNGGSSHIAVNDADYILDYDFLTTRDYKHPYASLILDFVTENGKPKMVDLSKYSHLSLSVKCSPQNILTFLVYTLDEKLTSREGKNTMRIASTFFSCNEEWTRVELDLTHLEVSEWWLNSNKLDLSDRGYNLNKTARFLFGTSAQTPYNTLSNVKISELAIRGLDRRFIYGLVIFIVVGWGGYIYWFVRRHTLHLIADVKTKMQKDLPLLAYQQLSVNSQKDRERDSILRFMATQYSNPDLNLDTMVSELAVSRSKINDIMKEELGYTFVSYLNKLRLTEAARMLSDEPDIIISEIAFRVGYKNVPYFNRLFKSEYGCTPKKFREVYNK